VLPWSQKQKKKVCKSTLSHWHSDGYNISFNWMERKINIIYWLNQKHNNLKVLFLHSLVVNQNILVQIKTDRFHKEYSSSKNLWQEYVAILFTYSLEKQRYWSEYLWFSEFLFDFFENILCVFKDFSLFLRIFGIYLATGLCNISL
jgi:hypothetical protein